MDFSTMRLWYLAGLMFLGCASNRSSWISGQSAAAEALQAGIQAGAASGISRASGGCWANCPVGTTCNPHSGLCEELPCRGQCTADEHCEVTPTGSQCVAGHAPPVEITIGRKAEEEPPVKPDTSTPPSQGQNPIKAQ